MWESVILVLTTSPKSTTLRISKRDRMAKPPNFPLDPSQFPQERDLVRYTSVHRSVPKAVAAAARHWGESLDVLISCHETHPKSIDFTYSCYPGLQHPTGDVANQGSKDTRCVGSVLPSGHVAYANAGS